MRWYHPEESKRCEEQPNWDIDEEAGGKVHRSVGRLSLNERQLFMVPLCLSSGQSNELLLYVLAL